MFAVVTFKNNSRFAQETFRNNLQKEHDTTEWQLGIYSVELDNVKEVGALKEIYKKNPNVKIELASDESKILDILDKMCKDAPTMVKPPKNW